MQAMRVPAPTQISAEIDMRPKPIRCDAISDLMNARLPLHWFEYRVFLRPNRDRRGHLLTDLSANCSANNRSEVMRDAVFRSSIPAASETQFLLRLKRGPISRYDADNGRIDQQWLCVLTQIHSCSVVRLRNTNFLRLGESAVIHCA